MPSRLSKEEKKALLLRAFSTEEGTRKAYQAAKLVVPSTLALTCIQRITDFQRAFLAAHTKQ